MKTKNTLFNQVWAIVSSGLVTTATMTVWGFPATTITELTRPGAPLTLTPRQASWFTSIPMAVAVPCSVMGGGLLEYLGPRRLILLLAPCLLLSIAAMPLVMQEKILQAGIADDMLLACRVVQGLLVALLTPAMPVYGCEVSESKYRGTLASFLDVFSSIGFLLCYVLGHFLPWTSLAYVLPVITLVPAIIGMIFAPTSPLWLARKDRFSEARETLLYLRSSPVECTEELKKIKESNKATNTRESWSKTMKIVIQKTYIAPIIVSSLILVLNQVNGQITMTANVVRIFKSSGVGLTPFVSSVMVSSTRVFFCGVSSLLLHRVPRKVLICVGSAILSFTLLFIGTFFFVQNRGYDVERLWWVPLLNLILYMVAYAGGIGPATWLIYAEILPGPVRAVGSSIAITMYSASLFLITKTFDDAEASMGLHGVIWCYGIGSVTHLVFIIFCVPETKGKTLYEIEEYWEYICNATTKRYSVQERENENLESDPVPTPSSPLV